MRNHNTISFILLITFSFLSNLVAADASQNIRITEAWISEAPPTLSILAGYLKQQNTSSESIALESISSLDFSRIEIHRSVIVDGMATMKKQTSLVIPANDSVLLSPGDYHLMLFDPDRTFRSGDKSLLNFTFSNGQQQTIETEVKQRSDNDHHHHQHQH